MHYKVFDEAARGLGKAFRTLENVARHLRFGRTFQTDYRGTYDTFGQSKPTFVSAKRLLQDMLLRAYSHEALLVCFPISGRGIWVRH